MGLRQLPRGWLLVGELAYVAVVGALAALGFIGQSPWPILLAALLTLPASLIAVPGYYVLYGLLSVFAGASPDSSSGSGTVAPDGSASSTVSTGADAAWFTTTTHALGIIALTAAAILNVLLLGVLIARRRRSAGLPPALPLSGEPV